MADTNKKLRVRKRRLCGHCNQELSNTLYYKHKQQYFDQDTKRWCANRVLDAADDCSSLNIPLEEETSDVQSPSTFDFSMDDFPMDDDDSDSPDPVDPNEADEHAHALSASSNDDNSWEMNSDEVELEDEELEQDQEPRLNGAESKALKLYLFFLLMFQTIFRCSDNALRALLLLFAKFFQVLGKLFNCQQLETFATKLPVTVSKARKLVGNARQDFKKYACCPDARCCALYPWNKKQEPESLECTHISFPNHSQVRHRQPCGKSLFKKVKTAKGNIVYRPLLTYCYKSVTESLQDLLLQPNFINRCEEWRGRKVSLGVYRDVYDGKIWEDFQCVNGKPFLSLPYNFALQLNIDWFQPFTHTQHSEGVIYMSVMNLPRSDRFLQENTLLVGVIPGPHEPKYTINTFLSPLVEELLQLWEGIILNDGQHPVLVRAALLCSGCDIPAARKTCGFVGHNACSKCLLVFPTENFGDKPDFSNFNKTEWTPRTNDHHRINAEKHRLANTNARRKEIERESGVRYSILLKLPYFDAPRMCIIDPMHNLYLGTAKRMIQLWKNDISILPKGCFATIQEKVDSFITTKGMGRLPFKIESGFAGFTAEQWKNWCLYFSLYALKGTLPRQHYQCWQLFCKACYFLCRRQVTLSEVSESDTLFEEFCLMYVSLYGKEQCTINLHLHCHLSECVKDFGPVYAFWLFAYERFNGIMGSYHTNSKNISVQLMERFLDSKDYIPSKWPSEYVKDFLPTLEGFRYQQGSLMQTSVELSGAEGECTPLVTPLVPVHECVWMRDELEQLNGIVRTIFNVSESAECNVLLVTKRSKGVLLGGFVLSSSTSRYSKSNLIFADRQGTGISLAEVMYFSECQCQIIDINSEPRFEKLWVIAAKWHMDHPCKVWFGYPSQVWSCVQRSELDFIPITAFRSRAVFTKATVNFGPLCGCVPIIVATPLESICTA